MHWLHPAIHPSLTPGAGELGVLWRDWRRQGVSAAGGTLVAAVHWLGRVRLLATPWTAARQASLPITISPSLLKLTSIESVLPSKGLVLGCPLLLLPSKKMVQGP